jgi:hypothetical protein
MTHLILCHKINDATDISSFFFMEIVRLHGLPKSIVLDRDIKFMGHFWRTFWKKLGKNISFSSTYHPHTDVKTEVVKQILGNFLRSLDTKHHN